MRAGVSDIGTNCFWFSPVVCEIRVQSNGKQTSSSCLWDKNILKKTNRRCSAFCLCCILSCEFYCIHNTQLSQFTYRAHSHLHRDENRNQIKPPNLPLYPNPQVIFLCWNEHWPPENLDKRCVSEFICLLSLIFKSSPLNMPEHLVPGNTKEENYKLKAIHGTLKGLRTLYVCIRSLHHQLSYIWMDVLAC